MATVQEALSRAAADLARAGVEGAAREAAWLLAHALGTSVSDLRLHPGRPLPPQAEAAFWDLVARRARREPLQYLLGWEELLGLRFAVTPAVLIPRPETEVLVRTLAERVQAAFPGQPLRLADIGTGSGCIAVGLCHLLPRARVVATDVSAAALAVAAENARRLGVADRVEFRQGDGLAPLVGEFFHAIASNPPYVAEDELASLDPEVRLYEPRLALTPGPDGLALIRRLVAGAPAHLVPGGFLALEVGYRQAEAVMDLMAAAGLAPAAFPDALGHLRCVIGRKD